MGLFELETDVVENVFFAVDWQGFQGHPGTVNRPDGVLVKSEALLNGVRAHRFVELVAAGEVKDTAVILKQ